MTVHARTSFRPAEANVMSSSIFGTLYYSDRKGAGRVYFRPAPFSSGAAEEDLETDSYPMGGPAHIVSNIITFPQSGSNIGGVGSVIWCMAGSCSPGQRTSIPLTPTEVFLTNTGAGVLVYDTNGTRSLRIKYFIGLGSGGAGSLPVDPSDPGKIVAIADTKGALLKFEGTVFYVDITGAGPPTVTSLEDNSGMALSSDLLGTQVDLGGTTLIRLYQRYNLYSSTLPPITLTTPGRLQTFQISDTAMAWFTQEPGTGQSRLMTSSTAGHVPIPYIRTSTNRSLVRYENTDDFLIFDATAPTPGFYRVRGLDDTGTLVGVLGPRDATTQGLALSHNRMVYSDDSTSTIPLFLRDVSALPTLGAELILSTATTAPLSPTSSVDRPRAGLWGPVVVFARPNDANPAETDVLYGQPAGPFNTVTLPAAEQLYGIQVSGHRALLVGGTRDHLQADHHLLDLLTGELSSAPDNACLLWGDYLLTVGFSDGSLRRTDLVTGAVATLKPADPASGNVMRLDLAMWGHQVAYNIGQGQTSLVLASGVWTATSATTGTTAPHPGAETTHLSQLSDGLLVTHDFQDRTKAYDLQVGSTAVLANETSLVGLAVDGYRVAWVPGASRRGVIADVRSYLPGYTLSPPLLVTSAAPKGYVPNTAGTARWQPHFYVSRDINWAVGLRSDATGAVVRTFGGVSSFGEVTLSGGWDGTDGLGADLPNGSYTWTLTGSADGQPLGSPKGSAALTGQLYLSRTPPAAPAVTAPAISTDTSATSAFDISWAPTGSPAGLTYTIRSSINGGLFTTLAERVATTGMTVPGTPGQTVRFEVTATDPAGVSSAPDTATTVIPYDDASPSVAYTGTWIIQSASDRFAGAVHVSGATDSTATFSAIGTAVALIGDRGPGTGEFQISYDGGPWSPPIDTYAPSPQVRQVLATQTFTGSASTHTMKIRVVGTSGRPNLALDAFAYTH